MSEKIVLNEEQRKAVEHDQGPLLVVAGAGTGKTRVITERIKRLVTEEEVLPEEILALTFTEKSAREMEERVDKALPMGMFDTWIMTFHGFCERVLRDEAIHIGLDPGYRVMSEAESYMLLKNKLPKLELNYFMPLSNPTKFISALLTHFSRLRDEDISPEEYQQFYEDKKKSSSLEKEKLEQLEELVRSYKFYQELKLERSLMDYADLIFYSLKLFRTRSSVLEKYQEKFEHILVDEFQDTNYAQNQLLLTLASGESNVMVVGDDDQSIFRFRGAAVYNVLDFEKHFPQTKTVTLTKNYRSGQKILDSAYKLIKNNDPDRLEAKIGIDKNLVSKVGQGGGIHYLKERRVEDEAEAVAEEIKRLKDAEGYDYQDIAILVRANNHSDPFVSALSRKGIPYQFLGPGKLYHQSEVKDLIAYLKLLDNFEDNVSAYRLLASPIFNVDSRDLAVLVNYARKKNLSLFESLENISEIKDLKQDTYEQGGLLVSLVHEHLDLLPKENVGSIMHRFLKDSGLLKSLADSDAVRKTQNLQKFFDRLVSFETTQENPSVQGFLEYLDLLLTTGESPLAADLDMLETDAVNVLTVHSAKGLEFAVVFMVNLVHLRFPSMNRKAKLPVPEDLIKEPLPEGDTHTEEERRLFYVGMTRAEERLYFTTAKYYSDNYSRPKKISPFISEALGDNFEPFVKERVKRKTLFDYVHEEKEEAKKPPLKKNKVDFVSHSQLDTFTICPLQYKYKHVLKIPTPMPAAASYGSSLHNTLRDFYRALKSGGNLGQEDLLAFFEKRWISEGFESKDIEKQRREKGREALKFFYKNHHDPENFPRHIEKAFNIKLGDMAVGGYIDRIDFHDDGTVEVIDYKTSKPPTERAVKKDKQLSIYALAVNSSDFLDVPLEKIKLSFYHFRDGKFRTTTRTKEELEETKEFIFEKVKEMEESDFEANVNFLCQYCPFQMICDAYQGSLKSK